MSGRNLVLGLEIHLHLKTKNKMFCRCSAKVFGEEPNTHTCPTCLGLPGALPVPNYSAVKKAQLLGLALNCMLNENSRFDRKHYNYPDLPKGYQISQYLQPLCEHGTLELADGDKIKIERIHLEEDTAKSFHRGKKTLIDFNKSGIPLVEIVTEPVFSNVKDAVEFSKKIQAIVRSLGIGDVDMEKGQMRLEANISLRDEEMEQNGDLPNYKVEIKNINSFKFMGKAVLAEIERQEELFKKGKSPIQENRGYDEDKNKTIAQRTKEFAHDYRYFPEPDIPPLVFSQEDFDELKNELPELPAEAKERLISQYGISEKNAISLITGSNINYLKKFEKLAAKNIDPEKAANVLLNRADIRELKIDEIERVILDEGEKLDDESELKDIIKKIIKDNESAVEDFKKGRVSSVEFLLGQVMRETNGKAEANKARDLIKKHLS